MCFFLPGSSVERGPKQAAHSAFARLGGAVEQTPSQIHLISPENRLRSQKGRVVWDYLISAIGDPPYWDDLSGSRTDCDI